MGHGIMFPGLSKCIAPIQNTLLRGNRFLEEVNNPQTKCQDEQLQGYQIWPTLCKIPVPNG